jgi:peroxiredoxin
MNAKRAWLPYAIAALAAMAVVSWAWANRGRLNPVEPGSPAPEFSVFDLQGIPHALREYRGKVVLLNIWATWCVPCKEEMPSMQRLYEAIRDDDFEVLAVSVDQPSGDHEPTNPLGGRLLAFTDSLGLTFPILHDPSGEISDAYQTTGVPESFVLSRDGIIFRKITGPTAWDAAQNVEFIRRLLEG